MNGGGQRFLFKDTVADQIGKTKVFTIFASQQWHSALGGYNSNKRCTKVSGYGAISLMVAEHFW